MSYFELPDYEILDHTLKAGSAPLGAAESHGLLCGMLCGGQSVGPGPWIAEVLEDGGRAAAECPECRGLLEQLYDWTVTGMGSEDFAFDMLLPEDARSLVVRTQAVADWARGFLGGLGLTGAIEQQARLPDEVMEILQDMSEIAKAGSDAEADAEVEERAIAEIIEYLRMAALLVQETLLQMRQARPLH
jgi:yecA family protein